MIIKPADDRTKDLETLQALLDAADPATARRIQQEIRQIKAGIRGEEEAAYEMRVRWGDHPGRMVLHDLRIEHDGLVAQIDHLMINRLLDIWVCESKHFTEGVAINEHGEFTAFFGSKPYGVPSPIEQNTRHITILRRFLESGAVKLPTRLGFTIKPALNSLVLVSKGARISRPKTKVPGLESVIKVDQLFQAIDKAIDDSNPLTIAKVVSEQTVQELARAIASHHKPASFNWAAKFGVPPAVRSAPATAPKPVSTPLPSVAPLTSSRPVADWAAPNPTDPPGPSARPESGRPAREYRCQACAVLVEQKVARFCWFNKAKFGGNIYCMDCQKQVAG